MTRHLIVATLIAAVAGLVVGLVLTRDTGPSCQEWQSQWQALKDETSGGALRFIGLTSESEELIALRKQRPEACPLP